MATVAKRGGKYVLDFYDHEGIRRRLTMPEGTTKARAKIILRNIEEQVSNKAYLPAKRIPTFHRVALDWLKHKKPNLRASTWSVYEGHTRNHFPEFQGIKISLINTARVEKWIFQRQMDKVPIATIRKILVTMGQIFSYAVRHGYIQSNPMTDAERPRSQGGTGQKPIKVLSIEGIIALLDATKEQQWKTLFQVAIFTGARQGELLGLKWSDIDWEARQVNVQRTFNNGQWYEPKTATSRRNIDVGPTTLTALREWRLACPPNDLDLIFPNQAGGPVDAANLRYRVFYPALKRAGLERVRFHDLRHTYASLMIQQGENIKYIQTQLGHSSPTVTLNVYAHLMESTNQAAAKRLENAIFSATGHKMVTESKQGATAKTVTP